MHKAEANARNMLATAVVVSILSAFAAMSLGLNGLQLWAIIAWAVAIASAGAAFFAYRRYSGIRAQRWQEELQQSERLVGEMLDDEAGPASTPPGGSTHTNPS
jgi:membrane protein implicated in regulation of membrane protease activity